MSNASAGRDLGADIAAIAAIAGMPVTSAAELAEALAHAYSRLLALDLAPYEASDIRARAPALMGSLFRLRMGLRDRIAAWSEAGLMSREVQRGLRDLFRALRYGTDMLGEMAIGNRRLGSDERPLRAFTGRDHNTFVHPRFDTGGNIPFRSGDVLIVRGKAHNSAAIARIGDVDTQFSHASIIHIGDDGRAHVVEALIEDGSVVTDLAAALDHGVGRAVLFRFHDPLLAARAAQWAHDRVTTHIARHGRTIPYDFSMRLDAKKRYFCAGLIHAAFRSASGGTTDVPLFKTRLNMQNRDFLRRIGVKAEETFAPGDLDIDPRFDLVAEWQDYRVTSALRRQDMIMTKLFEWMDSHGWRFREDIWIRLIAIFGRLSARLSERVKEIITAVVPKVPRHMPRRTIATIAMLHKTAETLVPPLAALEEDRIAMSGRPLHPREMLAQLEHLREVSADGIGYLRAR